MEPTLLRLEQHGSVAHLWLSRPAVRNAFNAELIAALSRQLHELAIARPRVLVLGGDGPLFCAGADAQWMAQSGNQGWDTNYADALAMAGLLEALNALPFPVIARVQGGAYGGGIGLLACCDAVIAAEDAKFSFGEVRLGIAPATIAPYVIAKIGVSAARDMFLSAAHFDATRALQLGLLHEVVPEAELDIAVDSRIERYTGNSPAALAATKRLIGEIASIQPGLREATARLIAELRASDEGREGLAAFQEKRKPYWAT
jgi:methylglutaconyl-CoA hydratase